MDDEALRRARENLENCRNRLILVKENFRNIKRVLKENGIKSAEGIILDLGVSSYQVDTPKRGFSFHHDAPLDMRMDGDLSLTAREVINRYPRKELVRVFKEFGEERWASRIASFIEEQRQKKEINTTGELVELIKSAVPARFRRSGGHPARKVFQALRIEVNQELDNLKTVLPEGADVLSEGGRFAVISYHSLEDRAVKHFFRKRSSCTCPPEMPLCRCEPDMKVITRRPVVPGEEEVEENPRARSARLRVAEKRRF